MHTQLILGVSHGHPEGFSLPAGEDAHFVIWSRVFSPDELRHLESREQPLGA